MLVGTPSATRCFIAVFNVIRRRQLALPRVAHLKKNPVLVFKVLLIITDLYSTFKSEDTEAQITNNSLQASTKT